MYSQHDLYKKALKANFKISKVFGNLHQNVNTILHLFDHTLKPILLYGSEIWNTVNINSSVITKESYTLLNSFKILYCDKLHVRFLKYVLGVHSKPCNDAVTGELGQHPLYVDSICNTVKYFQQLYSGKVRTLSAAFEKSKLLSRNNTSSWVSNVYHVFKHLNISEAYHDSNKLVKIVNACIQI